MTHNDDDAGVLPRNLLGEVMAKRTDIYDEEKLPDHAGKR